ncbi:MAG: hypothetical protein FWG31_02390 [Oscillospiraceae bacterium]|nr:hypothetical protein [Oscillospiraceae bacterium]
MEPKPLRLIGLAKKAGMLVCGTDAVIIAAGQAKLLLLSADAGNSAKREAGRLGKQLVTLPYNKEELGRAAGKRSCAIAAVTDEDFAQGIVKALQMEVYG